MNPLRKNIHILTILWAALSLAACTNEELVRPVTPQEIEADPGNIVLTLPGTARALSDGQEDEYAQSTKPEAKIARIDVLVFPDGEDKNASCVFHKRFTADNDIKTTTGTNGETTSYVVMAHKSEFNASQEYKVYVLANANSATRGELDAFLPTDGTPKTLADLKTLVVTTERVYLTGIDRYVNADQNKPTEGTVDGNIPRYFMMDATATSTDNGTSSTAPTNVEPLTLNDGNLTEGTKIYATLRRAAAKVTLILNAEEGTVKFPPERGWLPKVTGTQGGEATETTDQTAAARFQLTPTNIRIDAFAFDPLTGAESDSYLPATADLSTAPAPIFVEKVGTEQVSTWTYAYPHRWEGSASTYAEGSYLVVRVPIFYNSKDGKLETNPSDATWELSESSGGNKEWTTGEGTRYYTDNYYKIPMGKDSRLERNTHYVVTGTISAPGSTQPDKPVELTNIAFQVVEWQPENINIGEDDNLHFLYVNKNAYTIRNVQEDHTLTFSSSHPVTITVEEAYFTDKTGTNKYYYKDGEKTTAYKNAKGETLDLTITASADDSNGALSGGITLDSPVPDNNLPRIIKLKIENDERDIEYVTITQYPLDWIQYTEGVYSYWDHDQWSTYEYKRIGRGTPSPPYTGASKDKSKPYEYEWTGGKTGGFSSKYVNDQKKIVLYQYNNTGGYYGNYVLADGDSPNNLVDYRMYHIQITSTSDEYVIGRPKLDENGHTMAGEDNAQMVSPSFMINSQLGATTNLDVSNANTDLPWAHSYADHYAEVFEDKDGNKRVYRDWRLPTAAELRIISKFQGTDGTLGSTRGNEADAMFIVMNGYSYWTASGVEINGAEKNPDGSVKPNFQNASPNCLRLVRDVYDGEEKAELVSDLFDNASMWQKNQRN